ncbi:MAG: hypothetical protein QXK84_05710 [Nitrososphaerota archaeon]
MKMQRPNPVLEEILRLLSEPSLRGLATLRHYPMERQIYARFGRCGFAIDLLMEKDHAKRHVSVLVEAVADSSAKGVKKSYDKAKGRITCIVAEITSKGIKYKTIKSKYSNAKELFGYVEKVRTAFYERYRSLKPGIPPGKESVPGEIFHAAGIPDTELFLGV